MADPQPRRIGAFVIVAALFAVGGAGAGWWFENQRSSSAQGSDAQLDGTLSSAGIDGKQRAAIEGLVRSYILDHPEILPQAMERLQQRETAAQIAPMRGALETPFPGAVLGNPNGKITLVEFTDFACTYCRQSVKAIEGLIARNPDLRVVVRELPIIAPESGPASRMALAAAAQGKYSAYHRIMFEGPRPSEESIAAAASAAGMDLAAARRFGAQSNVEDELKRNLDLARQLEVNGTPAWVIGDRLIHGAVPAAELQTAIDTARKG